MNSTRGNPIPASYLIYITLGLLSLQPSPARAQAATPIEASNQELIRERERVRALRQQQERAPDVHLPREVKTDTARLRFDESPCFQIDRILIEGDAASRFEWALAAAEKAGNQTDSPIGRCIGAPSIGLIQRRVQNAILKRGFVTSRVLGVAIPVDKLNGFSVARPMGGSASTGWEVFANSYPKAGAGGYSQFLLNSVPLKDVFIFTLEP